MNSTVAPVPTGVPASAPADALERRVALIACGKRPGKTEACESHARRGDGLLRIALSGARDALAAAICGSLKNGACGECVTKADAILTAVAGAAA